MKKAKKKRRLTSLFFRILGGISIPLLCVLAVFAVLMLRREISLQKRLYSQEMRGDIESLNAKFMELVVSPEFLSLPELKKESEKIRTALELDVLDIFDPNTGRSIITLQNKATEEDSSNIQISLTLRREGKPYYLFMDEKKGRMLAFVPIREKGQNRKIYVAKAERGMNALRQAWKEMLATFWIMAGFILGAAFVIALLLTRRIIRPIREINRACRQILSGQLGLQVNVRTGDELELMASHFNRMSQALLSMTRQATDSNPLTGLPGNQGIASELSRRLELKEKFIFFHVDIDHFKAYNDHYGLKRGDDVLRRTGEILSKAVQDTETEGSFLGHQGGDDFVLMLDPPKAKTIAEKICKGFDEELKNFYDKEDFERGYFMGEDSRSESISDSAAEIKRHPLMSITLAGVTNLRNEFLSYEDVLERAVPVKKKGKKIPYSKFVIEE